MDLEKKNESPIDWESARKISLWGYEELIARLLGVMGYPFVDQYYNHSMARAQEFARQVRSGYLQGQGVMLGFIDEIAANLKTLDENRVGTYLDLLQAVRTRESCQEFLRQSDLGFTRLVQTLTYLLRWVLPFKTPLREFINLADPLESSLLTGLKHVQITTNLDLLEAGRSRTGREALVLSSGASTSLLTSLVHRADISRLAYVRGKTVMHLCGGGYDTIAKIAGADLGEMERRMEAHYHSLGKRLEDFKAVIPLGWMVGGAQILPTIVEE